MGTQPAVGVVVAVALSYLLGSVPIGYLYGRARGVDLRKIGSGNIGATNVYRAFGKAPAIIIFWLDVAKGLVAVTLIAAIGSAWAYTPIACGLAAIAGHVTSIFMRGRGGKGVATAVGVFLGLAPLATAICLGIWAVLFAAFRYVSLGSITGAIALPILIWLLDRDGYRASPVFYFALLVAVLVVVTHRANIGRLARGTENRIGRKREAGEETHAG
jgi:glycerol-3-phosphate acyltransferase PlsY